MKKGLVLPILCALSVLLMTAGCAGKYADAKKANREYMELVKGYIDDLNKTESARDAAKAINRFVDGMQDLLPRMMALAEKYPELRNAKNYPEELKEMRAEAAELAKKMGSSMMKVMPYVQDPEVQKAQKRLQDLMMKQKR